MQKISLSDLNALYRGCARLFLGVCLLSGLAACASNTVLEIANYEELAKQASKGEAVSANRLKSAFIAAEDFAERLNKLAPLERQVLQVIEDQPLKLGALGATILDTYYGSLVGHTAMQAYYQYLEVDDAALVHKQWADRLLQTIEKEHDGSGDSPYPVVSSIEAEAYLKLKSLETAGSIYVTNSRSPLNLLIVAVDENSKHQNIYFDLSATYGVIRDQIEKRLDGKPFDTGYLINYLARKEDSAAQALVGAYLLSEERYEDAIHWLSLSTRSGNVVSTLMLARIFQVQARSLDGELKDEALELALDHYLRAIAQGSDEAMYVLGQLYVSGLYGEDNRPSGLALLLQAADLDNNDAMLSLGFYYMSQETGDFDLDKAETYFTQASEHGHKGAQIQLARFLAFENRPFSKDVLGWLKELSKLDSPDAMIILGNLYARGDAVRQSFRRARSYYESAVDTAPDNAAVVNEVAWTLAVTELKKLQNPEYAFKIMSKVMVADSRAMANAAYLDTFAAACAAKGNFTRAIELQKLAIKSAEEGEQREDLEILKQHLEDFSNGRVVIDAVP